MNIEIRSLHSQSDFDGALRASHEAFALLPGSTLGRFDLPAARRNDRIVGSDPELSVVAVQGRRVVGCVCVVPYRMRVGISKVRVAGLRNVAVIPSQRDKGICTRLMHTALNGARQADMSVSMLFGIPDFYEGFGFRPALTWLSARLPVDRIAASTGRWRVRRHRPADYQWTTRWYNKRARNLTGSAIRQHRPRRSSDHGHIIESPDQRGRGYLYWWIEPASGELRVAEHGYNNEKFVDAMLAFLKRKAEAANLSSIRIYLHRCHPTLQALVYRWGAIEEQFQSTGGPMIALLDPPQALRSIRRELERRVSGLKKPWPARGVVVAADHQKIRISRSRSGLRFAGAEGASADLDAGADLGRLLLGHGEPAETIRRCNLRCRKQVRGLIETLFPAQNPYISPSDVY